MRFGLILGDQLHHQLATLKALQMVFRDVILMARSLLRKPLYVAHHPQKIALIFSAMRHFAERNAKQKAGVYVTMLLNLNSPIRQPARIS